MNKWISIAASAALVLTLSACTTDGTDGINGTDGVDGTIGTSGATGVIGATGISGVEGVDGVDGVDYSVLKDFGKEKENELYIKSLEYLGFDGAKKYGYSSNVKRIDVSSAEDTIDLADGLTASFLTRDAAHHSDLFSFYPAENPTHLISCIEGGTEELNATTGKLNPSVQSWDLATGEVKTLLRGMTRCDGLRVTDWGTVVATEETTDGGLYEIIDPLTVENHQVTDRATGTIVDGIGSTTASTKIVKRSDLATMAWEGLVVLPNGVVIGGDELRPGTAAQDADGGSIFKFVPATPRVAGAGDITDLSESPLVEGLNYAMAVSCVNSKLQLGQGCEVGNAAWIEIDPLIARTDADAKGATGYYRPEDMELDSTFVGKDANDIKFCWTNTGNESTGHYGEIMCAVDSDPLNVVDSGETFDKTTHLTTVVNRFVEGTPEFTSVDSLAIHPITGDIYGIEDHKNGDIWACLKDGADKDIKTDGCVRLLSVKDQSAEPTGFVFSPDGTKAYLSIQHSDDTGIDKVDDYGTDDIVVIDGFDTIQ